MFTLVSMVFSIFFCLQYSILNIFLIILKQKVNELDLYTSMDLRHLRVSVALLSPVHQPMGVEAVSYAHRSNAAYCGLFKKIKTFLQSAMGL